MPVKMTTKINAGPKILLAVLVIGGALFGARWYLLNHGDTKMTSSVPTKQADFADFKEAEAKAATGTQNPAGATGATALPSSTAATLASPKVKLLMMAWNAQAGLALANGGPSTTQGSLMEKAGVNLTIERQDDYSEMQKSLVACAEQLSKGGKTCSNGANFAIIMGDGGPAFLAGLNDTLSKLGPDFTGEFVGVIGRSFGEDKFMAPQAVKDDPSKAKGLLVAGVLRDGDWNIAMYWAANNEICNNPDPTTYDPNCLNWVGTNSFVEADDKFIQNACEDRPVVNAGKRIGETKHVCVNGVVTWTPGDDAVAKGRGGVVPILSTRENASQMPAAIIGIKKFDKDNHATVVSMLRAALDGGDQIKSDLLRKSNAALNRAAEAETAIYKEQKAAFWAKLYKGTEEEDKTGALVPLGGSRVFNLADATRFVGLDSGSANAFATTYTMFGDIAKQQYPKDLPTYPAFASVFNTSFLSELQATETVNEKGTADQPTFTNVPAVAETVAKRAWHINFDSGKATFAPGATKDLKDLFAQLVVGDNTFVEVHGHTDNTGSPTSNQTLSEARAAAVADFLQKNAPANFPKGRIKTLGHGQNQPVATNDTPAGKAQNRRVDIVLKANES